MADGQCRWALSQHLVEQGFFVRGTADGGLALRYLRERVFEIIVADLLLPGTRIAAPLAVRRRGNASCPLVIGLAPVRLAAGGRFDDLQLALSYDLVVPATTPVAVLTRHILQLMQARSQPARSRPRPAPG